MMEKWLAPLLFVREMNGSLKGKLRLQKLTCLLEAESRKRGDFRVGYQYELYHYGPFSRELAKAVEDLVDHGFLEERPESTRSGNVQFAYSLTPAGELLLKSLLAQTPTRASIEEAVHSIVKSNGYLHAKELVEKAYEAYHGHLKTDGSIVLHATRELKLL